MKYFLTKTQESGVTEKGGPTNPLNMIDDPRCLNSNECFLTLKPVSFSDQLLQSLSLHTLIIDRQGLHAHQFHRNDCRSKSFQLYSPTQGKPATFLITICP